MSFYSNTMQARLHNAFSTYDITLHPQSDYVIAENAQNLTKEKMSKIIETAQLCPLIPPYQINSKYVFTVVPYRIPECFKKKFSEQVELYYKESNESILQNANSNIHYERNKKNIISCAEGLTGRALILGFGNGLDIPLSELAIQFDQITVVDIDVVSMKKAIAPLPRALQNKIRILQEDLSGMLSFISQNIEELSSDLSEAECNSLVINIISKGMETRQRRLFSEKYHFVVSSMLTSQLYSILWEYIEKILIKKFPGRIFKSATEINNSLSDLTVVPLCIDHLEHLSEWTVPGGKIYYADTTHIEAVDIEQVEGEKKTEKKGAKVVRHETLPYDVINKKINNIFNINKIEHWDWTVNSLYFCSPTKNCLQAGHLFKVTAHFLETKKS
jgi:hypothetical protein